MMKTDDSAVIFDIQRFSIHDGPGIRTTVFFKGCPLRCSWCQNPESQDGAPQISYRERGCIQCMECKNVCPSGAIRDDRNMRIDFSRCNNCGRCADACPSESIRLIGRDYDVHEVFSELIRDRDFFEESGGGVTFSGGEPLVHSSFLASLTRKLKAERIHSVIETCGYFKYNSIQPILDSIDLIYYDLKLMDPDNHRLHTGQRNDLILENFKKLSKDFSAIQARMPVIPGINNDRDSISDMAAFLKKTGHSSIHCLPYHDMGKSKEPIIGMKSGSIHCGPAAQSTMEDVKNIFNREGIDAIIYS